MSVHPTPDDVQVAARDRAKWITLVVLLTWVALVFTVTVLKFSKVW